MSLQDPIVPKVTVEPLPRGPVIDPRTGQFTPSGRAYFERRGGQIGEILSGVDRNAFNIAQLETDYTAADGAISSAYISADAVVASDAAGARAALQTFLESSFQAGDAAIQADVDANTTLISTKASNTRVDSVESTLTGSIASVSASLTAETQARQTADSGLQTDINTRATNTRVDQVESDAASSLASSAAALTAAYQSADSGLQSQITTESSARASGDAAEAASREILTAQLRATESGLIKNAFFQAQFSGVAVPPNWASWDNGIGTWVARAFGSGYAFSVTGLAGINHGFLQDVPVFAGKKYLLSAEIRRTGGTLAGAGVYVEWFSAGYGGIVGSSAIAFTTDANTQGDIGSTPDGPTRWEKVVTAPTGAAIARVYAMAHFSVFGSIASQNSFYWRECNLRQITTTEARTEVLQKAFVDPSTGEAYAGIRLVAAASGSSPARVALRSGGGTGEVVLDGDNIWLGPITRFETTQNSFITAQNGYRYRYGGPFGANSDLLQWYGPTSTAEGSETKTNGLLAIATDGGVYGGPLAGLSATTDRLEASTFGGGLTASTGTATLQPQGGSGTYSVTWVRTSGPALTVNQSGLDVSFSSDTETQSKSIYRANLTDTITGRKATFDISVYMIPHDFSGDFGDINPGAA